MELELEKFQNLDSPKAKDLKFKIAKARLSNMIRKLMNSFERKEKRRKKIEK